MFSERKQIVRGRQFENLLIFPLIFAFHHGDDVKQLARTAWQSKIKFIFFASVRNALSSSAYTTIDIRSNIYGIFLDYIYLM